MAKTLLMRPQVMASLCTSGRSHLFSGSRALPCFIVRTKAHRLAPRLLLPEKLILGRRAGGGCGNRLEDGFFVGRRSFCTRASTQVNDSGAIDPPLMQSMEKKIKEHLNAESVVVKDAYGDGRHVSIDVISSTFEGQSAVNRQRMVYKAIWEELQTTVHAVDQMTTKTPIEAGIEK